MSGVQGMEQPRDAADEKRGAAGSLVGSVGRRPFRRRAGGSVPSTVGTRSFAKRRPIVFNIFKTGQEADRLVRWPSTVRGRSGGPASRVSKGRGSRLKQYARRGTPSARPLTSAAIASGRPQNIGARRRSLVGDTARILGFPVEAAVTGALPGPPSTRGGGLQSRRPAASRSASGTITRREQS
jgi:hypothetical protein